MTRIRPFGRDGDDSAERLTLRVEDRPTIERNDELLITPDVGRPYRATVIRIDGHTAVVRIPGDGSAPIPHGSSKRQFDRDELTGFYVRGDLLINPPERPDPCR